MHWLIALLTYMFTNCILENNKHNDIYQLLDNFYNKLKLIGLQFDINTFTMKFIRKIFPSLIGLSNIRIVKRHEA